jgi:hypothetical protein
LSLYLAKGTVMAVPSPDGDWRQHLHTLVIQCELRITKVERRIENHHRLWRLIAADGRQRRAHLQLDRNLLEGLKLLYTYRAMVDHELHRPIIPRDIVASPQYQHDALAKADADRLAQLIQTIEWLDGLSQTKPLCDVVIEQRDRAVRELWQIQKRQFRRDSTSVRPLGRDRAP